MTPRSKAGSKSGVASDAARRSLSRLERILLLVPYCVAHPGVSIAELARRFGAPEKEILDDLNLLFVCGLPDYTPADLIEVVIEEDYVFIRMADYFARPLRLTRTEAIPLYLKAQALVHLLQGTGDGRSGLKELDSLRSAIDKLGHALLPQEGGVAELTKRIKVQLESGEAKYLGLLRDAVTENRRIDLEYYTYTRDNMTRRKVDPHLVFASLGHWYFSGFCHLAQDKRMFRLDRIKSLELTDESFESPDDADAELPPPLVYVPGPDDVHVKIRVSREVAQWLPEYFRVDQTKELRGGRQELDFRTDGIPRLEKLLLRFGAEVEVIEPPDLAGRLQAAAQRILDLYEGPKKRS
jgi:proteasome accessory factor C